MKKKFTLLVVAILTATCSVFAQTGLPSCVITAPHCNAYFQEGKAMTIRVYSTDIGGTSGNGTISKVEFFNGTTKLGEATSGTNNTYTYVWNNLVAGTYTITAKATDNSNNVSTSAGVIVTVGTAAVTARGMSSCKGKYLANIIAGTVHQNYNTYWNGVTSENDCKWGTVESSRDNMSWTGADRSYNHAKNNNLMFRYHALAWGSQYPSWITSLSPADFQAEMIEYMDAVKTKYPLIDQIDVLNEQIGTHAPGTNYFRDGLGGNGTTGFDWQIWLFTQARQRFPNAKLVLNDYGLENDQNAIRTMLNLVKVLRDRNLIDGFGTQAHEFNINTLSASAMKSSLDLMATGGVPIYVTELDISGDDNQQNTRYQTLFPEYWNHPAVGGITLWGYIDGQTWKDNTGLVSSGNNNPTESPAMQWIKQYMTGRADVKYPYCTQESTGCTVPAAPTVTSLVNYCMGASASALTATGTSLKWYTTATGGTGSTTAPTPTTTSQGTQNFWVTQTSGTCESPRAQITVNVGAATQAPTVTSPLTLCQGATASPLNATGTNLLWYTAQTGGTGASSAITPSTTSTGTTTYYVSQTASGCESNRASIVVTVNASPTAPTVVSPVAYALGDVATPLSAAGTNLKWYTIATGGTSSSTAPTPNTSIVGTTTYYVSQQIGTNGCESPRASITVTVANIYKIYKTNTPIVIDGTIDAIWNNSNTIDGTLANTTTGTVSNANDLSGSFKAIWDDTYLYVLGKVTDDTKTNDSPEIYNDDAVEVYIDINNDKATTYSANDVQYSFGWNDGTTVGSLPSGRPTTNISYSMVATANGYILEARIPWSTIQGSPTVNQLLGYDFQVNDDDNGSTRDGKMAWTAATDDAWQNPSLFGTAQLKDIVTVINDYSGNHELSVYPNPFTENSNIELKGDFTYQLYNTAGIELEHGKALDKHEFGYGLSKGMYVLKTTQDNFTKTILVSKN